MKVICKETTAKKLDLKDVITISSNSYDYSYGGYGLSLNTEYVITGVALYKGSNYLYYLIDTFGKPNWYPYELFDIIDNSLPKKWFIYIDSKKGQGNIYSLWGFEELCNDEDFYDKLIDRDEEAMRIYFHRKIEMEDELSSRL